MQRWSSTPGQSSVVVGEHDDLIYWPALMRVSKRCSISVVSDARLVSAACATRVAHAASRMASPTFLRVIRSSRRILPSARSLEEILSTWGDKGLFLLSLILHNPRLNEIVTWVVHVAPKPSRGAADHVSLHASTIPRFSHAWHCSACLSALYAAETARQARPTSSKPSNFSAATPLERDPTEESRRLRRRGRSESRKDKFLGFQP